MDGARRSQPNGTGSGFFEYRIPWPQGLDARDIAEASSRRGIREAAQWKGSRHNGHSAGRLHARRRLSRSEPEPEQLSHDERVETPSAVTVRVNGHVAGRWPLADDPADSRGILAWHAQPRDGRLHEAGSYGQLLRVPLPSDAIGQAAKAGEVIVRRSTTPCPAGSRSTARDLAATRSIPPSCSCCASECSRCARSAAAASLRKRPWQTDSRMMRQPYDASLRDPYTLQPGGPGETA